jgi:hypothetical protein
MEIVLEQSEVDQLLREALEARGTKVPTTLVMRTRLNNKKGTFRVVFTDPEVGGGARRSDPSGG